MSTNPTLLLRGVTVVDPRDGTVTPDRDVLIEGERITRVGPTTADAVAAHTVDGAGHFVIPGLVDMHAHPLGMRGRGSHLALMLAYGVTGFRQMSGSSRILRNRLSGRELSDRSPRLLATAGLVLTPLNAPNPHAVVDEVRRQQDAGADFVKAGLVTAEVFYAAQGEANRIGIPILGHLPPGVDVPRVSGDGMASIEHLGPGEELLACCSSAPINEDDQTMSGLLRRMPAVRVPFAETITGILLGRITVNPALMTNSSDAAALLQACETFDEEAASRLADRLRADETWQVPTLIRSHTNYLSDDPALHDTPDHAVLSRRLRRTWEKSTSRHRALPASTREAFRAIYATMQRLTKIFDDAGVPLLAGSDSSPASWEVPGAALHAELDELAAAGLTPLRVLQLATSEPARFLGRSADLGSVEPGKYADLVLLDADPLVTVENLHRVVGVVRAGRHYDRPALDALRSQVTASGGLR